MRVEVRFVAMAANYLPNDPQQMLLPPGFPGAEGAEHGLDGLAIRGQARLIASPFPAAANVAVGP